MTSNNKLNNARAAVVAVVRMYAPVHSALTQDAARALETAMDNLQAAAVAAAQVPAAAPPVPASAQPPAAPQPETARAPAAAQVQGSPVQGKL